MNRARELLVMLRDGGEEYGALLELSEGGEVKCIVMNTVTDAFPRPPDDLLQYVQTINRLLKESVPFSALETMAQDSPRIGGIVEQIVERLAAAREDPA